MNDQMDLMKEYQSVLWEVVRDDPEWKDVDVRIVKRMYQRGYPIEGIREVLMAGMVNSFYAEKTKADYVSNILRATGIQAC